ncbi:MAG: hypothetical protein HQL32_01735 [Planctomycetes bacterium]|nr:hypothetical protein [Planctomycetota bacterium]
MSQSTLAKILLFSLIGCLSFCCGGSTSSSQGIVHVDLEGEIEIGNAETLNKSRLASESVISGRVYDLNNSNLSWDLDISESSSAAFGYRYKSNIVRRSDVRIEILRDGQLVLSKVLSAKHTLANVEARINPTTHLQAKMLESQIEGLIELDVHERLGSINQNLFGSEEVAHNLFQLSSFSNSQRPIAAIVATYGRLLSASSELVSTGAILIYEESFKANTASRVQSQYVKKLDNTDNTTAPLIASAHEGAKNTLYNLLSVEAFKVITDALSSYNILNAIDNALERPVFPSDTDALAASPGVMLWHTFPEATTIDALGISGYSSSWSSTPKGPVNLDKDDGRTLKYIPSLSDLEDTQEFTYTLTAHGINGKDTNKEVTVTINNLSISSMPGKIIYGTPIAGPVTDDKYLYLIANTERSANSYELQRFSLDYFESQALSYELKYEYILIPSYFEAITDMKYYDSAIYLCGGNTIGVISYDDADEQQTELFRNPKLGLKTIRKAGDHFYGLTDYLTPSLFRFENTLDDQVEIESVALSANTNNPEIESIGEDYLYVAGEHSGYLFQPNSEGILGSLGSFPLSSSSTEPRRNLIHGHQPIKEASLYLSSSLLTTSVSIDASGNLFVESFSPPVSMSSGVKKVHNGPFLFYMTDGRTIEATNLSSGNTTHLQESSTEDHRLSSESLPPELNFTIRNIPEGDGQYSSKAYLYVPGVLTEDTWSIRAIELKPDSAE